MKNLWHSIDERPHKDMEILMYDSKQDVMCLCYYVKERDYVGCDTAPDGESWDWDDHTYGYDMWLNTDDIKPKH
jgi:hypothetical protein